MSVLGFRADGENPRYAVLEKDSSGKIIFINKNSENRLSFPAAITREAEKLKWLYGEFERIFGDNKFSKVIIKVNEYSKGSGRESAQRRISKQEAVLLLLCAQKRIPVEEKLYKVLGTNSKNVLIDAAGKVSGKTGTYWDKKIADAIMAADWGVNN